MCCACDKRTGHLVIVWLALIYYVAAFILGIVQAAYAEGSVSGGFVAGTVFCAIAIGLCIFDIYGIHQNKRLFMIPFFIWTILTTVLTGIGALIFIVLMIIVASSNLDRDVATAVNAIYGACLAFCILSFKLHVYFCYVISTHMEEVKAQETQAVGNANLGMKTRRESWPAY